MFRHLFSKKKILIIGIFLIIIGLSLLSYFKISEYLDINKHTKIINRSYYSGETNKYDNLKYIIIPSENVKRIIMDNASKEVLDQNYVGLVSGNLNSKTGNVILAGHNIKAVFHALHKLKIGSEIILKDQKLEKYEVINKYETLKNDSNVLKTVTDIKQLTLITCTKDPNYRLIVIAKKK